MTNRPYVFLDPDGREDLGLILLVLAPTGIEYGSQVAGYLTEQRSAEGFLIPLGWRDLEEDLADFFETEFSGHSYQPAALWTEARLSKLGELGWKDSGLENFPGR